MDPFSAGMFASIGSAFKFADVAVRIAEVGSENAVFVRTIYVVRSDLEEVERLWSLESVQKKLTTTPGKLPWIKTAIHNTRYALNEIGRWVERARVEQESTGSIKFDTRVRWVFSDHEKLKNRNTELSTCHQQLSNVLGYLLGLEVSPSQPLSQEYEDTTHLNDILARHRRTSRPQALQMPSDRNQDAVENSALHDYIAAGSVSSPSNLLLPISGHRSLSNIRGVSVYERDKSRRSTPVSSTLSPPSSPPPTYASAVSIDPFAYDARPDSHSPSWPLMADVSAITGPVNDSKVSPNSRHEDTWSYRGSLDHSAIPELAGDSIVFSATNSAGPVNPYELCASPRVVACYSSTSPQRRGDNLSEMLGDLHFPAGLPSNDFGPPPGYPSRPRAPSDTIRLSRTNLIQARNRSISETPPVVHRRPLPVNALSDPLLTVHELPSSLAPHNTLLEMPCAVRASNAHSLTTASSSDDPYQLSNSQRPSSYAGHQSHRSTEIATHVPNRHYSVPTPPQVKYTNYAAAFSAESTGSWGLDTQPKAPVTPRAQESAMAMRMHSQKRMMDLLGTLGT